MYLSDEYVYSHRRIKNEKRREVGKKLTIKNASVQRKNESSPHMHRNAKA